MSLDVELNQKRSGIALLMISAATLCFEINLTRLFSVSQFYHFAFMVISIALFGMSASGTYLALQKKDFSRSKFPLIPTFATGSGVCMLGSYLLVNHLHFDSFRIALDPSQVLILVLHYIALASPFFYSGAIIGMMLSHAGDASSSVYALNLVGSAIGCLIALVAPGFLGGEGTVVLSAFLAGLASLLFLFSKSPRPFQKTKLIWRISIFPLALMTFTFAVIAIQLFTGSLPEHFKLRLSPYKSISYALQAPQAKVVSSAWNSFSRIDVIDSPSLHSFPGLSYRYLQPLPNIKSLFIDGDNLNAILPADADLSFTTYLPASIVYILRPAADVLLLEPKGGMDIMAASYLGAQSITTTEANPLILSAAYEV